MDLKEIVARINAVDAELALVKRAVLEYVRATSIVTANPREGEKRQPDGTVPPVETPQ